MRRHLWKLVRVLEICLFCVLILFVTACFKDCNDQVLPFKWRGKVYRMWFSKFERYIPVSVVLPDGKTVEVTDPRVPFQVQMKDGVAHISPRRSAGGAAGGGAFSPRAAGAPASSPPFYTYLLSDAPQDAIYILDQQTDTVAGVVPLPTLPKGIAVSNSGDHAYVTNQGIEAGNPFFPQAPPRVRVIDKTTRAVSSTIDLPNGMNPGKPVVSPDDRFVYVPGAPDTRLAPNAVGAVAIIDAQTRLVVGTIPVTPSSGLSKAAITPDGALLFVVATQSIPARVFVIDTFTREQVAMLIVPNSSFRDLLVDYTGSKLYLLNQTSLVVYDTATLTESGRLTVRANGRLNNMALSIDGGSLFINDELSTSIVRVDTGTLRVAEDITFPGRTTAPDLSMLLIVP